MIGSGTLRAKRGVGRHSLGTPSPAVLLGPLAGLLYIVGFSLFGLPICICFLGYTGVRKLVAR
jgi:hypothetical protein